MFYLLLPDLSLFTHILIFAFCFNFLFAFIVQFYEQRCDAEVATYGYCWQRTTIA